MKTGRIEIKDLEEADEVFLTNAIKGIRWVKKFGEKTYSNERILKIYKLIHSAQTPNPLKGGIHLPL